MKNRISGIVYNVSLFSAMALLFAALGGCEKLNVLIPQKKEQPKQAAPVAIAVKGTLVARVNNIPITLEELNEETDAYNAAVPQDKPEMKITTRDQKFNYLKNEMVRRTLLYQEASDRGLDKSEEVMKALEKIKQNLLVSQLVRQEAEKVDVASKEVEDYYNTYKEQLKSPEERNVREIVVSTEPEAKDIMIQLLQGGDFATLAKDRSKSASAKDGGDLGFVQKGKKFSQFDSIAFSDSLEVGKVSSIFKGPEGYYILKLEGKRGGQEKALADMWDDIKKGLTFLKQQKKIEDLVGKISTSAKLEIYEGEIK